LFAVTLVILPVQNTTEDLGVKGLYSPSQYGGIICDRFNGDHIHSHVPDKGLGTPGRVELYSEFVQFLDNGFEAFFMKNRDQCRSDRFMVIHGGKIKGQKY
jgi:hypothetical protein